MSDWERGVRTSGAERSPSCAGSWLSRGMGARNREEAGVAGTGTGLVRIGAVSIYADLWREEDFELLLLLWGEFEGVSLPEVRHRQTNPALTGE